MLAIRRPPDKKHSSSADELAKTQPISAKLCRHNNHVSPGWPGGDSFTFRNSFTIPTPSLN
ncbi:MAG TPA: hypothetical protein VGF55_23850 [Gemmataceae bacterium]